MGSIALLLDNRTSLKLPLSMRFFLLITSASFAMSLIWLQFLNHKHKSAELIQQVKRNDAPDLNTEVYIKKEKLKANKEINLDKHPRDLKYILLWSKLNLGNYNYFGEGQRGFIRKRCPNINCYVTDNKNFFNGDTTKFDAIVFSGLTIFQMKKSMFPKYRSSHQKFIYFNLESADRFLVCSDFFDNFFNWTVTYRLDSDVPFPYIQIRDTHGKVVGPKKDMQWPDMGNLADEELEKRLQNKTKAAAWFVSNCYTRSRRFDYVKQLKKALNSFGWSVDIYGYCGPLKCPKKSNVCYSLLKRDYVFYLSFENSFAEDYVTEKLLTALQHNVIPIVRGGANYSRFLPPGSYIDASLVKPKYLASVMARIMLNSSYYIQFFRWRSHYTYHDPVCKENVCALCEALNDKRKMEKSTIYKKFRDWWYPNYVYRCI